MERRSPIAGINEIVAYPRASDSHQDQIIRTRTESTIHDEDDDDGLEADDEDAATTYSRI